MKVCSMFAYITRRIVLAIFTVWAVSVLAFAIIQLPPGDYITSYIAQMASTGSIVSEQEAENLRIQYGLDRPIYIQYYKWMAQIVQGSFGMSMEWRRPVLEVIGDRLWLTVIVSLAALLLTWVLALPIGIYSAVRQYSLGDYLFTFIGFIGLAVPSFLLALVVLYLGFSVFGANIGGLFSTEYQDAPWSLARFWDLTKHLPIPAIILGLAGTAQQIRIMRANLLDELRKPYVVTARAKGLTEAKVILKYPVRVALNPFASTLGYAFPYLVSGSIIVSVVLSLPTVGPLLLKALIAQDMFLAGTIVLLLGIMTVIGTLVSDILLVLIDPRIRLED
jgi:peptide/nickel transport system permease protein